MRAVETDAVDRPAGGRAALKILAGELVRDAVDRGVASIAEVGLRADAAQAERALAAVAVGHAARAFEVAGARAGLAAEARATIAIDRAGAVAQQAGFASVDSTLASCATEGARRAACLTNHRADGLADAAGATDEARAALGIGHAHRPANRATRLTATVLARQRRTAIGVARATLRRRIAASRTTETGVALTAARAAIAIELADDTLLAATSRAFALLADETRAATRVDGARRTRVRAATRTSETGARAAFLPLGAPRPSQPAVWNTQIRVFATRKSRPKQRQHREKSKQASRRHPEPEALKHPPIVRNTSTNVQQAILLMLAGLRALGKYDRFDHQRREVSRQSLPRGG